jgi:hypothetical protein
MSDSVRRRSASVAGDLALQAHDLFELLFGGVGQGFVL